MAMTTPDYRAALAELVEAVYADGRFWEENLYEVANRARTLLAALEVVGVADEELTLTYAYAYAVAGAVGGRRGPFRSEDAEAAQAAGLRAVLARYGTAHPAPVPVGERLPELRGMFERILSKARCMETRTVGNIELAERLLDAVADWALPLPTGAQP